MKTKLGRPLYFPQEVTEENVDEIVQPFGRDKRLEILSIGTKVVEGELFHVVRVEEIDSDEL